MESESLTSIGTGVMYALAQREGAAKERRNADRRQGSEGGNRADGAVQEAGPNVRSGGDAGRRALPARRRDRAQEPLVGGQGGDGRGRVQRLAALERPEHRARAAGAEGREAGEEREGQAGAKKNATKKPRAKANRAASKGDSYGWGACGTTFATMKAATKHAMTHTSG